MATLNRKTMIPVNRGPLIGYRTHAPQRDEMSARTVKNLLDRAKRNGLLSET